MSRPMSGLVKAALGIALTGSCSMFVIRWTTQSWIRESVSYKEAMECLRSNENIVDLLGEPIKEKSVDVGDNKCYGHDDKTMWVSVPLKGKRNSGYLHYRVTVDDPVTKKFHVSKIEFEVTGASGQRLTLREDRTTLRKVQKR